MITLFVNENQVEIEESANLNQLMQKVNLNTNGVAIAINNQIISKDSWDKQTLNQNDNVLLIKATQGG
jgi:sulfur carrier protein